MRRGCTALAAIGASIVLGAPARANVGQRTFRGTRTTEPSGLRDIAIEHEQLGFDLRPLGGPGDSSVTAIYTLNNRGIETVTAPLVFVGGGSFRAGIDVTLDSVTINGSVAIPTGQGAMQGYGGGLGVLASVVVAIVAIPTGTWIARRASRR